MERERRRQLAEALQEALTTPAPGAGRPLESAGVRRLAAHRRRQRGMLALFLAGWAVLAWLWIARPAFIFAPLRAAALSPVQEEASLRYALYLQAARLRAFEVDHGRLPSTLSEVDLVEEGLHYAVSGREWSLRGASGPLGLELTSRMSTDSFLGRSLEQLRP